MKTPPSLHTQKGFSLIVTVTVMVLLSLIAVGILSLSTATLRSSGAGAAKLEAEANARLALQMALATLQETVGDDRRITAGADFPRINLTGAPNAVGVWESWSPNLTSNPAGGDADYKAEKSQRFLRWLVSGPEDEVGQLNWIQRGPSNSPIKLFSEQQDGFNLAGEAISINEGSGSYAWAASQENTKAKVAVAGPEFDDLVREGSLNDALQAQPRPNVEGEFFRQPDGDWSERASKVVSLKQAMLDPALNNGEVTNRAFADFSATSAGLLTNVVDGGLKIDLSLGFEMADSDFESPSWSGDESVTLENPFRASAEKRFQVPGSYQEQRPLYAPLSDSGNFVWEESFWPANVAHNFPVTAVPTFDTLRSYYRIPYHLYAGADGPTVFEREVDHVAATPTGGGGQDFFPQPSGTVRGVQTQTSIRPVLDRVMFLISAGMNDANELRVILTPVITLWNPYNVALETEGSVAHVWLDFPFEFEWRIIQSTGRILRRLRMYTSGLMSNQFINQGHGRSVNPYFYAAITPDGQPITTRGNSAIRFEPGEVRVFTPASKGLTEFQVDGSIRDRTVFLRPVNSIADFNTTGGFTIPTKNFVRNEGFVEVLEEDKTAQLVFDTAPFGRPGQGDNYPFYISLEDATRARGLNPTEAMGGQAIADILTRTFTNSKSVEPLESPRLTFATLSADNIPIGVIEAYHRVANEGSESLAEYADLVYTGNPRQAWMNPFVTDANFQTGPQYETRMRQVNDFSGVLQTANGGRSAYYGGTQDASGGRTHLSFFEIPTAPLLSLAAFQHCDLSSTPYAPANQFANSWASAYVPSSRVSDNAREVDHCYLTNEALWDSTFFSGAAPRLQPGSSSGGSSAWDGTIANVVQPLESVLEDFLTNPRENTLRNPRMKLADPPTGEEATQLLAELLEAPGCLKIAGELMVDGAFNVNSTSVPAWKAVLSGLQGATFEVEGNQTSVATSVAPFPRFRDPVGGENDVWNGYRTLDDTQIGLLAEAIVKEVRARGPFLSLAEFINRRVGNDFSIRGALQQAIDATDLNANAMMTDFKVRGTYSRSSRGNISPANTGVGIPGYLTQADLLKPLAPIITVRSDTFTIRTYGDSRDRAGRILAQSWLEATVQRFPDFVDDSEPNYSPMNALNEVNARFGRRLRVTSLRYLSTDEARILQDSLSI